MIEDTVQELEGYIDLFRDKTVLLNLCQKESPLIDFFFNHFEQFQLYNLYIITFSGYTVVYDGVEVKNLNISNRSLLGDELKPYYKDSDIILLDIPKGLIMDYLSKLTKEKKDFFLLGNLELVKKRDIFKKFRGSRLHLPYVKIWDYDRPDWMVDYLGTYRWFTNIKSLKNRYFLPLCEDFDLSEYKCLPYTEIIICDTVSDIPKGYRGKMAVPFTFLDFYCNNQFVIIDRIDDYIIIISRDEYNAQRKTSQRKKIKQYSVDGELVGEFISAYEARKITHIDIYDVLKRKQKTAGGFIWEKVM